MSPDSAGGAETSTHSERAERTREFVQALLDRYASYHQHKEGAAYAGLTLFGGVAGAAALSDKWPPDWGRHTTMIAVIAVTLLWAAVPRAGGAQRPKRAVRVVFASVFAWRLNPTYAAVALAGRSSFSVLSA